MSTLPASTVDPPTAPLTQLPTSTAAPTPTPTPKPKPSPTPTPKPASTPTSITTPRISRTKTDVNVATGLTPTGGSGDHPSSSSNSSTIPFASAVTASGDLPITGSPVAPGSSQSPAVVVSPPALASERSSLGPIIGGAVGGVVFLAILVVAAAIIILKRRLRVHGDAEALGSSKQAQAPTPYQYNQPHLLSDGSADLKGSIPRTSISKASTAAPIPQYTSELNVEAGTSERGMSNHSESPGSQMKEQSQNLGVDTSNLNRRLTTHTVASQQTSHSEALPPYKQFSVIAQ